MMFPNEVLIHKNNYQQYLAPHVDGELKKTGAVPRPWDTVPCGGMKGVPKSTIAKITDPVERRNRINDLIAAKGLLSDVRMSAGPNGGMIPSRDQNGRGYCWAHSTISAALLARAKAGLPYADLSAYAIACMIKNYRDEGGWNGESMQFLREKGCPTSKNWKQQSTSRSNDNPETWAEAALYKDTEWEDIPDRDFDTLFTYLLLGIPCPIDENWWSHSICAADPVNGTSAFNAMQCRSDSGKAMTLQEFDDVWETSVYGDAWGVRIWNSWGDSWSTNGMGVLTQSKATPDGSIALRQMRAA